MYQFCRMDYIKYALIGISGVFLILYLFYDQLIISMIGSVLGIFFIKYMKLYHYNAHKREIKKQFKEGLYALSSSIQVGKSIESAFVMAVNDLRLLYADTDFIIRHFKRIISKLSMNIPIEEALLDFAIESEDEDIQNFVVILVSTKRSGGNIIEIMRSTSNVIHDKLEILDGIKLLVTQKKYEQHIMMLIMPVLVCYLKVSATNIMDVMYTTLAGRCVMTISLLLYMISYYIGYKIVSIEV
ncbi:MAG: type II secretion system F family protein [Vallitaleaceae bacterium]|jgi:tight adherence protein B|nr:type II secretion system F family protein [Vallitaleaceae bacterium]